MTALDGLARRDQNLAAAIRYAGPLPDRRLPRGFATIAKIIVEQQLSLAAAEAIWKRLLADLGEVTPELVLSREVSHLKSLGLGARKAEYVQGIATTILSGELHLDGLHQSTDADALAALTAIRGIGPWTAEVYLLFAEARHDIFPAGDVALQTAAGYILDMETRPGTDELRAITEAWRPWRGVAARILWQVYRRLKEEGTRS